MEHHRWNLVDSPHRPAVRDSTPALRAITAARSQMTASYDNCRAWLAAARVWDTRLDPNRTWSAEFVEEPSYEPQPDMSEAIAEI